MNKLMILAGLTVLAACQSQQPMYELQGTLSNAPETGKVYLQKQLANGELIAFDSTTIKDGKFILKGSVDAPQLCYLCIDTRTSPEEDFQEKVFSVHFYIENSPITFNADLNTMPELYYNPERKNEEPIIKGSATEDLYASLRNELKQCNDSLLAIDERFWKEYSAPMMNDKEHKKDYTDIGTNLVKTESVWKDKRTALIKKFIQKNAGSVVALDQLTALINGFSVDYTAAQLDEMRAWVANNWKGSSQLARLDSLIGRIKPVALGEKYIDIDVQTPDGKMVKLSSLIPQGKFVMLEFWASWCGPCRAEIPHLVRVHEKYKDFTIVSISVDDKEADWQKAMKEEKMNWTQARLIGGIMGESTKKYNITGVPTCIVLDGEGRFYRTNTRGAYLDAFLKEIYGR